MKSHRRRAIVGLVARIVTVLAVFLVLGVIEEFFLEPKWWQRIVLDAVAIFAALFILAFPWIVRAAPEAPREGPDE